MLTPRFELLQNDEVLTIKIYAPLANIKDTEVYVEETDFRFYSSPYYLRLNLPGKIEENDDSKGSYDCDTGTFTLKFSKINKGENFDNLDMISRFLEPRREPKPNIPMIEVIGNPVVNECINNLESEPSSEGDEWHIPQVLDTSNPPNLLTNVPKYGFANKISSALTAFESGFLKDVIDLPEPDSTPMNQRKVLREADEQSHFSDEHYMADLHQEDELIKPLIDFQAEWERLKADEIQLTDHERDILKEMHNKEYLLDGNEIQMIICGLVDILYSSCYNYRTTLGEGTTESGWDINKISATLCWFQTFSNVEEVIKTCIRRSLSYPLYRHWGLALKVFEDVKKIIQLGKKCILKRLCEIHELFNATLEPRYILNQLYIKDYIIWLQQAPDSCLQSLFKTLESISPQKANMGLDLVETEAAFWATLEEERRNAEKINGKNSSKSKHYVSEAFINNIVDEVEKLVLNDVETSPSAASDDSDSDSTSASCSCSSCSSRTSSSNSSSSDSYTSESTSDSD